MNPALNLMDFSTEHQPRPYVNALVRQHHIFTPEQRLMTAQKVGWNVFDFPSEMLMGGDLISDSGTTTLTVEQFALSMLGDEAYGSNWGYPQLIAIMEKTFGISNSEWEIYLFHQGRTAEHALFSHLTGDNLIIPANSFFDTTRANAEANGIRAVDLTTTDHDFSNSHHFKGNINTSALTALAKVQRDNIPLVLMTITNNTAGGQPVSMENLQATRHLCNQYNIPLLFDACRFAENAWFIQQHEPEYQKIAISDIAQKEFSLCDGFIISFKKDGLANMGGALTIRKNCPLTKHYPALLENLRDHQILTEGHPTYGGLSGREIMVIVAGLKTVVQESYLQGRIMLVNTFGEYLASLGIPIIKPIGGHAVYIDTDKFFQDTDMRREDFGGIALTALLLLKGIRLCELGAFAFGKYEPKIGKDVFPTHLRNYVRAAVPRNKYERDDLFYVADCIKALYDRRHDIPKAIPVYGREKSLRHFKARFELKF